MLPEPSSQPFEHEVVALRANGQRICLEQVDVLGMGHRERVVGGDEDARSSSMPSKSGNSVIHKNR